MNRTMDFRQLRIGAFLLTILLGAAGVSPCQSCGDAWQVTNAAVEGWVQVNDVTYGDEIFVAVGVSATLYTGDGLWYTSSDGLSWNLTKTPGQIPNQVGFGNGTFVASGPSGFWTSPDGIAWTKQSSTLIGSSILYANGQFVMFEGLDGVRTSPDANTWTKHTFPRRLIGGGLCYGHGLYVAVGTLYAESLPVVLTSPDAVQWTEHLPPFAGTLESAASLPDGFVAVGKDSATSNHAVIHSPDGANWTFAQTGIPGTLYDVCYAGGNTIAAGAMSTQAGPIPIALVSPDGTNWTPTTWTQSGTGLEALSLGNGRVVAVGQNAFMVTSDCGPPCSLTCSAEVPVSGRAGDPVPCAGSATTDCPGGLAFSWSFGDGTTSSEQNPSHIYQASGTFNWELVVTASMETCIENGTTTVAPCTVTCTADVPSAAQVFDAVTFSATATPLCAVEPTFDWDFGDGSAHSSEPNPAHAYDKIQEFTWKLTVAVAGSTCTKTGTIQVLPLPQGPTWVRSLGGGSDEDGGRASNASVAALPDGGFLMCHAINDSTSYLDSLIKLDTTGETVWQKFFQGVYHFASPGTAPDGECRVAAFYSDGGGQESFLILGLSPEGTVSRAKLISWGGQAIWLADGGILLFGTNEADTDFWAMMLDSAWTPLWQKEIGGPQDDLIADAIPLADGGVLLGGETKSFGAQSEGDPWLVKLGATGQILWQKRYHGSSSDGAPLYLGEFPNGDIAVFANTLSLGSDVEGWLARLNPSGDVIWQKAIQQASYGGWPCGMVVTPDGGLLLLTSTQVDMDREDLWLVKLDGQGGVLWQKSCQEELCPTKHRAISTTYDGGFLLTFNSRYPAGGDEGRKFVVKMDANGEIDGSCAFPTPVSVTTTSANFTLSTTSGSVRNSSVTVEDFSVTPAQATVPNEIICQSPPQCSLTCSATADPTGGNAPLAVAFTAAAEQENCTGTPTFSWTFGDGEISTEPTSAHIYDEAGTYAWTLTVTVDDLTCTRAGEIVVGAPPCTLTCTASADPMAGSAPLVVGFTSTAQAVNCNGAPAFSWVFGDGGNSSEQSPSHTYAEPGTYPWTLTVTVDDQMCTRTGTMTVDAPCTLTCTATADVTDGHKPLTVSFTASAEDPGCPGPLTYAWTFGDGGTSDQQNPTHIYETADTFTWTLTIQSGGQTCTQSGTIAVKKTKAGDGNGDDTVSIGEVQRSINMFLGVESPEPFVDCDSSGAVTIGEVQKVINAFLGLESEC